MSPRVPRRAPRRLLPRLVVGIVATSLLGVPSLALAADPDETDPVEEPGDEEPVEVTLPPGGTFADDDGNRHQGDIEAIAEIDVTRGCDEDGVLFCPDSAITRAQMAAFVVRTLELPASDVDAFGDDDGGLFEPAINALAAAGITTGCEDGSFCPGEDVTRGELAAFLRRAGELPAGETDHFPDDDGGLFEDDINAIADAGIVVACADGTTARYCSGEPALRDQMASYLARFLGLDPVEVPPREEDVSDPEDAAPEDDGQETRIADDPYAVGVDAAIAHWFPEVEAQARAIVQCESRFNPGAVNPNGGYHGLFQLGEQWHVQAFASVTGESWADAVYTPWFNAQYARHLYDGYGWSQWTCQP